MSKHRHVLGSERCDHPNCSAPSDEERPTKYLDGWFWIKGTRRDFLAWKLANAALRIGSQPYRELVSLAIQRGLYELEEDRRVR